MPLLVKNIIELNLLEGAKIVAGQNGINNEILWVNLMEILDSLDSLQKGELLVTTGYQIDDYSLYKDIILKLKNKGVAGIAIQTGYYTDEVPEYIKLSADENNFPVIELPQNLTFSHITHTLIGNINLQLNLNNDSDIVNLRAKLTHVINSDYHNYLHEMLYNKTSSKIYLFLFSVHSMDANREIQSVMLYSINKIEEYFLSVQSEVHVELCGKKALFTVSIKNDISLQDISFDISKILSSLVSKFQMNFLMCVSLIKNTESALASFNDALTTDELMKKIGARKGVCFFEDLKLFKLLEIMQYSNYTSKFAYDTLKAIIDQDTLHNTDYLETLRLYLMNECNITNTADKLFVHRHTLKNRLNKISELSGIDFSSYHSRMIFSMALFIYDYFII